MLLAKSSFTTLHSHRDSRLAMYLLTMQDKGCDSFILDLRNNPGGLVRAGLDIARLWLPGEAAILTVEGRDQNGTAAAMQVSLAQCCITHRAIAFAYSVAMQFNMLGGCQGILYMIRAHPV